MLRKISYTISSLLLLTWAISCTTKSREKLIIGTWIPVSPMDRDMPETRVKFLPNRTGVAERKGVAATSKDSVTYEIKNEGKLLVTTDRSGKVEEVEIVELNQKNLIVVDKKHNDTIKLVRE